MNLPLRVVLCASSAFLILFLVVGNLWGERQPSPAYKDLQLFTQSIKLIRSNYVEEVDTDALLRGARKGLVESLDPYSSFVEPERAKDLERGEATGDIGLALVKGANGMVRIVAVRPGSPAEKGGLRAGRWIRAIDGRSTRDVSLLEAQRALLGPVGSRVAILLVGSGEEEPEVSPEEEGADADVPKPEERGGGEEFVRADLSAGHLLVERPREGFGLVRLFGLGKGAAAELRAALETLRAEGRRQLVLDLRDNPGGDPEETVAVASLFLPAGTPVLQLRHGEEKAEVRKTSGGPVWEGGLSVLQAFSTLAEAEVLAAALRDGRGATLVGERTFGKGLRQESFRLPDGSLLHLSTQVMLTGKGEDYRKTGIKATVEVERISALAPSRPARTTAEALPLGVTPEQVTPPAEPPALEEEEDWNRLLIEKGIEALQGSSGSAPPAPDK